MSKGFSGHFQGTIGTTHINSSQIDISYSDRNLEIPQHVKQLLSKLQKEGDRIVGTVNDFSMKDVSIMSKEAGVEFARFTIGDKTYLIRGNKNETPLSYYFRHKVAKNGGTFDFHTHPHDDDCVPSPGDCKVLRYFRKRTGQITSQIVTPNGRLVTFSEHGAISTGTVPNLIDESLKQAYLDFWR